MKTTVLAFAGKTRKILIPASLIATLFLIFTISSCYVGTDGRQGNAYVAFEWEISKPEFIDCGTSSVPLSFYYGSYYRISPGWYTAYYEGKVWNGSAYGSYAWEMDYEIWINQGQRGGYGYNGKDGMNTYLNFICRPDGPYLNRHDSYLRTAPVLPEGDELISDNGDEIVIERKVNEYTIRITYRKVEPGQYTKQGNTPLN